MITPQALVILLDHLTELRFPGYAEIYTVMFALHFCSLFVVSSATDVAEKRVAAWQAGGGMLCK